MKTIHRIEQYIESKGFNKSSFERKCGLSSGYLSKQLARNADIGESILTKVLENNPDLSREWLYFGEGEMLRSDNMVSKTTIATKKNQCKQAEQEVPLYDVFAAAGCVQLFQHLHSQTPIGSIKIPNLPKCDGAIFVRGESMFPIISSGDIVLYKTLPNLDTIIWGETYIVSYEIEGDYYTVVKYVKKSSENPENIILASQNTHHQPYEIHISQVKAMAHVQASIRYNSI